MKTLKRLLKDALRTLLDHYLAAAERKVGIQREHEEGEMFRTTLRHD